MQRVLRVVLVGPLALIMVVLLTVCALVIFAAEWLMSYEPRNTGHNTTTLAEIYRGTWNRVWNGYAS